MLFKFNKSQQRKLHFSKELIAFRKNPSKNLFHKKNPLYKIHIEMKEKQEEKAKEREELDKKKHSEKKTDTLHGLSRSQPPSNKPSLVQLNPSNTLTNGPPQQSYLNFPSKAPSFILNPSLTTLNQDNSSKIQ